MGNGRLLCVGGGTSGSGGWQFSWLVLCGGSVMPARARRDLIGARAGGRPRLRGCGKWHVRLSREEMGCWGVQPIGEGASARVPALRRVLRGSGGPPRCLHGPGSASCEYFFNNESTYYEYCSFQVIPSCLFFKTKMLLLIFQNVYDMIRRRSEGLFGLFCTVIFCPN
jgi:hypothetical protein